MQAATFTRHRNAVQANASSMPGASRVETPFVRIWEDLPGFVGKLEKFAERASDDLECDGTFCGCSSMVEPQPSKLAMPVRSRSPAPRAAFVVTLLGTDCRENNAEIKCLLGAYAPRKFRPGRSVSETPRIVLLRKSARPATVRKCPGLLPRPRPPRDQVAPRRQKFDC